MQTINNCYSKIYMHDICFITPQILFIAVKNIYPISLKTDKKRPLFK